MHRLALSLILYWLVLNVNGANKIYYYQEKEDKHLTTVNEANFKPLKEKIYQGTDNGCFWFIIQADPTLGNQLLTIPHTHISRAKLFKNGVEIRPLDATRHISFDLKNNEKKNQYLLWINCVKEANIPISILPKNTYIQKEGNQRLIIGLYYGVVLSVIIFNLFSFFNYRNITYLYYVFMLVSLALTMSYRDGMSMLFIGNTTMNEKIEPLYHLCVGVSGAVFATNYVRLNHHLPKLQYVGVPAIGISFLFYFCYLFTNNFILFIITEIAILVALTIYWGACAYLYKKSVYAKVFTIGYGLILILAYDFYISSHVGLHVLDLTTNQFRIGSIVEMVVFTYAIIYQGKILANENKKMRLLVSKYADKVLKLKSALGDSSSTDAKLIVEFGLSHREFDILKSIAAGKTNKEIGEEFSISTNTVKFHIRNIYEKLNINSRKEATHKYMVSK